MTPKRRELITDLVMLLSDDSSSSEEDIQDLLSVLKLHVERNRQIARISGNERGMALAHLFVPDVMPARGQIVNFKGPAE